MPADRLYDVILFGATGFTGRQTVEYFARHAPAGVRWAIAARSKAKLELVRAEAGLASRAIDIVVADSRDQASVDAMVSSTRVLLTTAGPFALYGTPVVDACVRVGTHYCDITGETPWIREMIDRYHARASADGTRIVTCCGFDSVPADIGTLMVVRALRDAGTGTREVRAYYRGTGGFNGGTIASMANIYATQGSAAPNARLSDPFLLDPPVEHSTRQKAESRDVVTPFEDTRVGTWVGPFLMAVVNTRVVRRSAALAAERGAPYGQDFLYQEYQRYGAPLAAAKAIVLTALLGVVDAGFRTALGRQLFTALLAPGAGPSKEVMDNGWFRTDLRGAGEDGRVATCTIHHTGDPGNRATVRFLCESALALATESDARPAGGGVLTPAAALGDVLARRLRAAGVEITVESGGGRS
jgi:short subunit dehydrogenase-like uncharacterized protein